jgi:hypothetical protein
MNRKLMIIGVLIALAFAPMAMGAREASEEEAIKALVLCARERGQLATVRVLVEAGADVSAAARATPTGSARRSWTFSRRRPWRDRNGC